MKRKIDYYSLSLLALMIVGIVWFYSKLPQHMVSPFHQIFVLGSKLTSVIICLAIMILLTIAAQFPILLSNSNNSVRISTTQIIMRAINLFYFSFYLIFFAFNLGIPMNPQRIDTILLAFLMIFIGNRLPQMKFQSWIGFKMPWVVNDENCWRATHRFLGFTSIPLGILQIVLAFVVKDFGYALAFGIGTWFIIGLIYSLAFYAKHKV